MRTPHVYAPTPYRRRRSTFSVKPAQALARRLLRPRHANQICFRAVDGKGEWFRVCERRHRPTIEGTSISAVLAGLNTYLGHFVRVNVSWNGDSLNLLPAKLPAPAHEIVRQANVSHRFALNDTDDAYTGAYRTWQDWEHEIDVLALHGINEIYMPVGTEAVYLDSFQDFGCSEAELLRWIPLPSHQPWWLLQNLSRFSGAVSRQLVERRAELGARIASRLRELGITPVLPGYFGTVPHVFAERNSGANVVPQGRWFGFERPGWLDPTGPYFDAVADAFYRYSAERSGATSMYKMDLLHEGGSTGPVDIAAASRAVEAALRRRHPRAIWAILGWADNPPPEILSAVDRSKMLVLDGLSDRYPVLDREKSWQGTPYTFGSIWNFGGHTTMGANMGVWNERYQAWKRKPDSALDGIAVLPEASDNNPVAFDLLTSLAWSTGTQDMQAWYADWATRRYGGEDTAAQRAWAAIGSTAYRLPADGWAEAQDGVFGAQPRLTVTTAAAWSPHAMRYDVREFASALPALIDVVPELRRSAAYRYDLADVARQVLSNRSRELLPLIKAAYGARDRRAFQTLTSDWLESMDLLERVTATNTQTMLGPWLAKARSWGAGEAEANRLEHDTRRLLSVWGDMSAAREGLCDYANREWAGLVSTYYRPRWCALFEELDATLADNRPARPIDWYAIGDAWAQSTGPQPTNPTGDIHAVAADVVEHIRAHPLPPHHGRAGSVGRIAP